MQQPPRKTLRWDVFCRVIDNHGDLGVCWRLACRLAELGQSVRLWVDDASALAWMAPRGGGRVQVLPWSAADRIDEMPHDVVVEAFGCDPPAGFVTRMAEAVPPPVWINLEYLSAEPYARRSHGLPSPQLVGPGAGLDKWFFFPGFEPGTGGLLREPGLGAPQPGSEPDAWFSTCGIATLAGAHRVSLFCYEQPALGATLRAWRADATQLFVTPGPAARQVSAALGSAGEPGTVVRVDALQAHFLPWLEQPDYDRLLAACDMNYVRGEDSLVRALWARRPFVWQAYSQHDGAHAAKLEAFLDVYLRGVEAAWAPRLRQRFEAWNGLVDPSEAAGHDRPDPHWRTHAAERSAQFAATLQADGDLGERLYRFAAART